VSVIITPALLSPTSARSSAEDRNRVAAHIRADLLGKVLPIKGSSACAELAIRLALSDACKATREVVAELPHARRESPRQGKNQKDCSKGISAEVLPMT
jgi:hypothetical protein